MSMNVGIFLVDRGTVESVVNYWCAKALVRSIRETMPGVPVVQLTDHRSLGLSCVDEVKRIRWNEMALLRMQHHADVMGNWLFLDADVLIQQDVRPVFDEPFDIALCDRHWSHVKPAEGFSRRMPWNTGVVFSRCPSFWQEVVNRLEVMSKASRRWMGDQYIIGKVARQQTQYAIEFLDGAIFNFPPSAHATAELEAASIVHYKGPTRKLAMLARIGTPLEACV
jgi:hypothetical protein